MPDRGLVRKRPDVDLAERGRLVGARRIVGETVQRPLGAREPEHDLLRRDGLPLLMASDRRERCGNAARVGLGARHHELHDVGQRWNGYWAAASVAEGAAAKSAVGWEGRDG